MFVVEFGAKQNVVPQLESVSWIRYFVWRKARIMTTRDRIKRYRTKGSGAGLVRVEVRCPRFVDALPLTLWQEGLDGYGQLQR